MPAQQPADGYPGLSMLQACVNGSRPPRDHPAIPFSPKQIGADAEACIAAGATELHIHPKADDGADTMDAEVVAAVVTAVRERLPGTPIGVTTGAWIGDADHRLGQVRQWTVLPDYASVNWHEDGAEDLAALLIERGVGVEAGLWTVDAVRRWVASPVRDQCLRALVELPDGPPEDEVPALAEQMLAPLRESVPVGLILLHGEGSSAWPAIGYAGWAGLDTRIGLEDTLVRPDGAVAKDNAELVIEARRQLWQGYP
ncbi:3-keto-5-aminohexanoate cleavage protein [Luteipulveratus mongoliensis]|uniref:3-keto-5-aminohexanoate cleavage protein n=1 Tax=Luteipulveratus mongoliensis TaxID=571913 RepID=A0A0K1JIK2_9MICO|nr:3-keto-5-aminohexanoate cleavage protein [Luteipulveratus mongoliensis]AKU16408.1 hypothetical protein VV02_11945 [Luteipulveratus mongoliensis]